MIVRAFVGLTSTCKMKENIKTVTIRITDKSKNSVLQDTTNGCEYEAYLLKAGENYPYEPFLTASQPAVNFRDDTGERGCMGIHWRF